jgi:hypothetical protein
MLFKEHPLMRQVLLPYATGVCTTKPDRKAVFFLATELLEIRDDALVSQDPRYPFDFKPEEATDVSVVRLLRKLGFCRLSDVARAVVPPLSARSAAASLQRLLRAGIVLQSTAPAGRAQE